MSLALLFSLNVCMAGYPVKKEKLDVVEVVMPDNDLNTTGEGPFITPQSWWSIASLTLAIVGVFWGGFLLGAAAIIAGFIGMRRDLPTLAKIGAGLGLLDIVFVMLFVL